MHPARTRIPAASLIEKFFGLRFSQPTRATIGDVIVGLRRLVAALVAALLLLSGTAARGAPTVRYAWVQWAFDGRPHVRAITTGGCPEIVAGERRMPMHVRALPQAGFPDTVCDALYPAGAGPLHVATFALPAIPRAPTRIAVFGDSGCRVQGKNLQACNDTERWPMPVIVKAMAAARPQLVIDVGDYYYRETPCPADAPVDCARTPYGDRQVSWDADWFAPAQPLFAIAPLFLVRGNHEDCNRGAVGWSRYLSGLPGVVCTYHDDPSYAFFDNLTLADVDSSSGSEFDPDGAMFAGDERLVDSRAQVRGEETWLVTHKPPVAYLYAHGADERNGRHLAALLSGHIHTFGAYAFAGAPPQLIVGTGGDTLAAQSEQRFLAGLGGVTDARFGYAIFERAGNGWDVSVYAPDTTVRHRCRLAARTVSCTM
jgi:hypothetical protein